jgi:hypothetical protein
MSDLDVLWAVSRAENVAFSTRTPRAGGAGANCTMRDNSPQPTSNVALPPLFVACLRIFLGSQSLLRTGHR